MAHTLRLAIAAPRFWPLVEDASTHLLRLAESLIAAGHSVTVVSGLWQRSWPPQMLVGTVPLVRLPGAPRGGLATVRWMYSLAGWLREQAPRLDAVLVGGLRHEAYVALRTASKSSVRVVLLSGEGDVAWQRSAAFGGRIAARCRQAASIVAPTIELADELAAAGYERERITVIPRRVKIPPPRSQARRDQARAALAAMNYDLAATSTTPVALAAGRLDAEHRFSDLVRAWRIVTARKSDARLWIVGDGPWREKLYHQISDLDQRFRVLIPGTFDCLAELLEAADLFLSPAPHTAPPLALLEALAAGLPVLAADAPAIRSLQGVEPAMLFPPGDAKAIGEAICQHLAHPAAGIVRASAIRQLLQAAPTPADEAAAYANVLRQR
jgi:glycosyltransferase involved in cell wall biosynthesis